MSTQSFTAKVESKPAISVHEVLFTAGLITKPRHGGFIDGFSLSEELETRIGHGHVGNEQRYKDVANALYLLAMQAMAAKSLGEVDTRMGLQLGHSQFNILYDPREMAKGILGFGTRSGEERVAEGGEFLLDVYQRIQRALDKVLEQKRGPSL